MDNLYVPKKVIELLITNKDFIYMVEQNNPFRERERTERTGRDLVVVIATSITLGKCKALL
jgi:hypothetical protein